MPARQSTALLQLCRSLVLSEPGESHVRKVHALLVQAYTALGRLETALNTCVRGLAAFPGDKELLFRRGSLAQRLGRVAEAEAAFHAVLAPAAGAASGQRRCRDVRREGLAQPRAAVRR